MFIDNLFYLKDKLIDIDVSDIILIKNRLNKLNNSYLKELLEDKQILEKRGIKSVIRRESKI